jgi:hypothetical protein
MVVLVFFYLSHVDSNLDSIMDVISNNVLENWLSLLSTLEEVQNPLQVMVAYEEVSKLVPLWNILKYGPHGKML